MFICNICGKEFNTNSGFGQHFSYMHGPNSEFLRKMRSRCASNQIPISKGKTKKELHFLERPNQLGKKFGISLNGHTNESRKKISESMKGNRNSNNRGDRQSFYKGIRMDSKWEVGVAFYFDSIGVHWKYGENGFILSTGEYYFPDFFIYENNIFIKLVEVKGYFRENNKRKFELFKKEYPTINIELWQKKKLFDLNIIDHSGYLMNKDLLP